MEYKVETTGILLYPSDLKKEIQEELYCYTSKGYKLHSCNTVVDNGMYMAILIFEKEN